MVYWDSWSGNVWTHSEVDCSESANLRQSNLSQKWSSIWICINLDLDPDVCWITSEMWIHYSVGISHFAECRKSWPVTMRHGNKSSEVYCAMVSKVISWPVTMRHGNKSSEVYCTMVSKVISWPVTVRHGNKSSEVYCAMVSKVKSWPVTMRHGNKSSEVYCAVMSKVIKWCGIHIRDQITTKLLSSSDW